MVDPPPAPAALAAALREEILDGSLRPGERLREEALAARLACGRHTLRAAFQQLAREGLVELERNRGAAVATPDAAAGDDLHACRSALELGALAVALGRGASLAGVGAAVDALATLPPGAPWPRVADAHHAIHAAIVATAGSERLDSAYAELRTELLFFVTRIRPWHPLERLVADHRHLAEELASGDADRARGALVRDLAAGALALRAVADG